MLAATATFLRMDLAIALRRLLLSDESGQVPDVEMDVLIAKLRVHEPQQDVELLLAAAQVLHVATAEAGAVFGEQQVDNIQQGSHMANLASWATLAALQRMLKQVETHPKLREACAAMINLLITRWSERLAFCRDDQGDEEQLRLKNLREKGKVRKLAIAQRLDDQGRELLKDMRRITPGGVDWDQVEEKLVLANAPANLGPTVATPGETDARQEYWS
jgi:hypothetical protein